MDKNLTLQDLQHYLQEIYHLEQSIQQQKKGHDGPSSMIMSNLLRYSSALNVLKTSSAGRIFQLSN